MTKVLLLSLLLLLTIVVLCEGGAPRKAKRKRSSIYDQGLVVGKDLRSNSILRHYQNVLPSSKAFKNPTLGFVTPWYETYHEQWYSDTLTGIISDMTLLRPSMLNSHIYLLCGIKYNPTKGSLL